MNHDIDIQDAVGDATQGIEWMGVIATAVLCAAITALALSWPI